MSSKDDVKMGEEVETEEEYIHRVYGTTSNNDRDRGKDAAEQTGLVRRLSRSLSSEFHRRRRSSLKENLPQTYYGWTVFLSTISSMVLRYEMRLQKSLTCPPVVYGQVKEGPLKEIYGQMTKSETSILRRNIQPSLFVGTRGVVSSTAAFLLGGPAGSDRYLRFREMIQMPLDGTLIAVDWELPFLEENPATDEERKNEILNGKIEQPVTFILHGMNNDASFGYVRSMARTMVEHGFVAAAMNMRGCGGVDMKTPRSYNGAYTGDIRGVVQSIVGRLGDQSCIFLIGSSLGANLVTKYLGEEGLSGSLPQAVAGGVALGNPLVMNSSRISLLWSAVLASGAKKGILENWSALKHVNDPGAKRALWNALTAVTLKQFDEALAPVYARNNCVYPFDFRPGFENADEYGNDAASYKVIPFVPVPFLTLAATDDMIVYHPSRGRLAFCLSNPNVMFVETMCGGHLGWQESPPDKGNWGFASSWADSAAAEFIEATLVARRKQRSPDPHAGAGDLHHIPGNTIYTPGKQGFVELPYPRSRL